MEGGCSGTSTSSSKTVPPLEGIGVPYGALFTSTHLGTKNNSFGTAGVWICSQFLDVFGMSRAVVDWIDLPRTFRDRLIFQYAETIFCMTSMGYVMFESFRAVLLSQFFTFGSVSCNHARTR